MHIEVFENFDIHPNDQYISGNYPNPGIYILPINENRKSEEAILVAGSVIYIADGVIFRRATSIVKKDAEEQKEIETKTVSENLFLKTLGLVVNKDKPYG